MKATRLQEAINIFDPREPLRGEKLKQYYVEREGSPLKEVEVYLRGMEKPVKLLFTGHRGSGKSTELNRLATHLDNQFFIVHFSATEVLNPFDLTYVDLILAMALQLFGQATDKEIMKRQGLSWAKAELLDGIWDWFNRHVIGEDIALSAPKPDQIGLEAGLNLQVAQLGVKFSTEAPTRTKVRDRVEMRLSELLDLIRYVTDGVKRRIKREVLIIVEDIDKLDLAKARDLFLEHSFSLTEPGAYIVYTFPVSLRYCDDFPQINRNFDEPFTLPNVGILNRNSTPNAAGQEMMRDVVYRRLEPHLIDEAALNKLIEASGGLMVTLIELAQRSAVYAISQGQETIGEEHVVRAIAKERSDYQALLSRKQLAVLHQCHQDKTLSNEEEIRDLLHNISLLEYANDEPWCDVHPAVLPLVKEYARTHPPAEEKLAEEKK